MAPNRRDVLLTGSKADLNWNKVECRRNESGLPVIVESTPLPSPALEAVRRCSAVWIMNHGGRQLENGSSAVTMLPHVVDALHGARPVIVNGGVHRGTDVFRALALGASDIAIGRPPLYGSALGGAQGVKSVHAHSQTELVMAMQPAGTPMVKRSLPTSSPTPKRTTDINAREFASFEAARGIMSQAKLADSQTYERANDLKIIQGYQGAHA